jgi:hypothetical protein
MRALRLPALALATLLGGALWPAPAEAVGPVRAITVEPDPVATGADVTVLGEGFPTSSEGAADGCTVSSTAPLVPVDECVVDADGDVRAVLTVPVDVEPASYVVSVTARDATARDTVEVEAVEQLVEVPDLVGSRVDAARGVVAVLGLTLAGGGDDPERVVAEQDPVPGVEVRARTEVRVTLAPPTQDLVTVPDLLDLTVGEARPRAVDAGLTLSGAGGDDNRVVAAQNPRGGEQVERGSAVEVTLAPVAGELVAVPALVGRSVGDALDEAARLGLTLRGAESDPDRTVATQAPDAGTRVAPGSVIEVSLAIPPTDSASSGVSTGTAAIAAGLLLALGGGAAALWLRRVRRRGPPPTPTLRVTAVPDPAEPVAMVHDAKLPAVRLEPHPDPHLDVELTEVPS